MTFDLAIRELIKSHYVDGKSVTEIYEHLNKTVKKRTIYNWVNVFKQTGSIECKKIPGRPRSVRTKKFVDKVKKMAQNNKKQKSARAIARENNCSHVTVLNALHDDLNLKCYRKIKVPALTSSQIDQRMRFATWIRNNFTHDSCKKIIFFYEKMFDADGQLNPKNDVVYAESRYDANIDNGLITKKKFPKKVMVWVGMTFNGITEVVVLPPKTSFNTDFYVSHVIPIARRDGIKLLGNDFVFQQDGARCHTSNTSIETIQNLLPSFIHPNQWPANSPDLNPLDYFFWNEVSKGVTKLGVLNREDLIKKIKKIAKKIPLKMI